YMLLKKFSFKFEYFNCTCTVKTLHCLKSSASLRRNRYFLRLHHTYHQNCAYSIETVTLLKKMLEWPKEILFPVLDITRLAVRNKEINGQIFDNHHGPNFVKYLLTLLTPGKLA
ncbi:jg27623, partial [Pararge aegeria aegeria]